VKQRCLREQDMENDETQFMAKFGGMKPKPRLIMKVTNLAASSHAGVNQKRPTRHDCICAGKKML
jgi:hypothetical protein